MICLADASVMLMLGYRPFLTPIGVDSHWLSLIPLVILISVVYKAIKIRDLAQLPRQSAIMALQVFAFMALAAVLLWLIVELV